MTGTVRRSFRDTAMMFLVVAALLVLLVGIYLHEIQALLPIASLLLTLRICLQSDDRNVRRFSGILTFYFAASTLSNIAWYLVPAVFDFDFLLSDNYYYVTGMFWIIGYFAVAYVLLQLKNSRQWYIERRLDRLLTIVGVAVSLLITLFVILNINWSSKHLIDIFILLVYLSMDVMILTLAVKLLSMNLKIELRHLLMAAMLFFLINMTGDILFEGRWLFHLSELLTLQIGNYETTLTIRNATNDIYNISLMIMTVLLFLFTLDRLRTRTVDEIRGKLKDTQLFVDDLIAKSPDATCIFDHDGRLVLVNDPFLQIFGLKRKDIDRSFNIFTHIGTKFFNDETYAELLKVRDLDTVIIPRLKLKCIPDGRQENFYLYLKMFPTYGSDGRVSNYVMIIEDITVRMEMEMALRQSEEQYRNLVENVGEWIWENDREGRFTYSSPKVYDLLGYRPEELIGLLPHDLMTPENAEKMRDQVKRLEENGEYPQVMEAELLHMDGHTVFLEVSGKPVYDRQGNQTGFRGVSRDVTARKQAEEALRESEEKFRHLAETSPAGIIIYQGESIVYMNPAAEKMTGYTLEELPTMKPWAFMHPDYLVLIKEKVLLRKQGVPLAEHYDVKIVTRGGRELWSSIWTTTTAYKNRPAGLIIAIDITERKQAEEALRESEARYRTLIDNSPLGILTCDLEGNITSINPQILEILGSKSPEFTMSVNLLNFEPVIKYRLAEILRDCIIAGESRVAERSYTSYWGKSVYLRLHLTPLRDRTGQIYSVLLVMEDITERKRLEGDLRKAYSSLKEEYERKIDFTNAAAHELRTPLTPIIGYTDILKAEVKDERHRRFLEIIERNALRQKTLVNRMLELASLDAGMAHVNCSEMAVRPLAVEIADNYRAINPNIRVEVPEGMLINTDSDILRHLLDNLVSNAVKFSDSHKEIVIRVVEAGDSYQFSVQDQGSGIPREEWGKIFERFYIVGGDSDSRTSGRSGLGLALVKAYIRLIGGHVWIESDPGKGSTFFFTVPRKPSP
ncbi:MAG TPA: PAS domain S-box protein [Methanocella sp.]|jgi:PAS domain S-box-containing protein